MTKKYKLESIDDKKTRKSDFVNAPLYNKLMRYSCSKLAFHMPGHKFGSIADLNKLNLSSLDNTEAMGMDNLYEAEGIIKEAMIMMADFYGARETLFLTNGSTAGILASILTVCKQGDKLIVARNAHHSVWSGLVLAGVTPIYVSPEYDSQDDLLGEMKVDSIREAIALHPDAKGVLIVSPTYEGIVSDIRAIAEAVHETEDMVLIVDEAHGAHFVLGNDFPLSSVRQGADLVINSMHKTLPALTQSALVHLCSDRVNYEDLVSSLRMIQTSSPSYMMMGLMDYIRSYIVEYHHIIKVQYTDVLIAVRKRLAEQLKYLKLIERDHREYDISKIIISTKNTELSGYELAAFLDKEFNIVVEAALDTYIILMTTMADNQETLGRLEEALMFADQNICTEAERPPMNAYINSSITVGKNPRDIFYSEKEWIPLVQSEDRISVKNVMLYPPGIPIVCMGETIRVEHIEMIMRFANQIQGTKIINEQIMIQVCKQ